MKGIRIMSQEKVNQYKESKRNRKQQIAQAKKKAKAIKAGVIGLIVAIVIFIGASVVKDFVLPLIDTNNNAATSELDEKYLDLDSQLKPSTATDAK
ncbi:MAG: hypothetical protein E7269_02010 [Lachnospiraceae bacterium]|nr:hypothetical protein [Lachnospiraceae bacterium]